MKQLVLLLLTWSTLVWSPQAEGTYGRLHICTILYLLLHNYIKRLYRKTLRAVLTILLTVFGFEVYKEQQDEYISVLSPEFTLIVC